MGFLVQSSHGGAGNFEVVVQRARGGGAFHWWRDNDDAALPWHGPSTAFGSAGDIGATSLIQSNFGAAGNLEVVATQSDQLVHSWRDDGGTWLWKTPTPLAATVAAQASPAFVQGGIGTKGNFEVVAALAGGGMGHWWRDNDDPNLAWHGPSALFGGEQIGAVALVHGLQSGNLELIARAGDQLQHWWRAPGGVWHQGPDAASGVSGRHDLCQNTFAGGPSPHYEVVAPLVAGGMGHWWADPLDPSLTWHGPTPFASGQVLAVGLVQPHHGTLEVVAVFADRLEHWWRDAGGPFAWHGPSPLWQRPDFVPAVDGSCAIQYDTETVAIHAALLHTGKVVMWSFADFDDSVPQSRVLDLATGQLTTPPASHHVFCSGHAFAGDGTLVVTGGHHDDVKAVHTFSPSSDQWSHVADMAHGRWYPTAVALPDGRVLTVSGTVNGGPIAPGNPVNDSMEVIDAGGGMGGTAGLPSPWSGQFPAGLPTIDLYPFVFVLPSGQLLFHSRHVSRRYDPASGAWGPELPGVSQVSRTYPCEGSAVLLPLQPPAYTPKVLVVGGGGANPEEVALSTPSTASAEILDLGDAQPAWRSTAPMAFPRVMPDAVLLPDGSVAVVGGSATGLAGAGLSPVYPIERFDPATETWSTLCDTLAPRLYHSCALLLPDGRVLIAGKDAINNPDPFHYPDHRGEVLWPPYLFAGPPPAIGPAPGDLHYGQPFAVATPDAARVDAANLLRAGSVTHSFNMGQRLVGLEITSRSGGSISLVAPPHHHIAPPGWYLLHLLSAGVPSSGRFIHVG